MEILFLCGLSNLLLGGSHCTKKGIVCWPCNPAGPCPFVQGLSGSWYPNRDIPGSARGVGTIVFPSGDSDSVFCAGCILARRIRHKVPWKPRTFIGCVGYRLLSYEYIYSAAGAQNREYHYNVSVLWFFFFKFFFSLFSV